MDPTIDLRAVYLHPLQPMTTTRWWRRVKASYWQGALRVAFRLREPCRMLASRMGLDNGVIEGLWIAAARGGVADHGAMQSTGDVSTPSQFLARHLLIHFPKESKNPHPPRDLLLEPMKHTSINFLLLARASGCDCGSCFQLRLSLSQPFRKTCFHQDGPVLSS